MTLAINGAEFLINDERRLWKGSRVHDRYQRALTSWKWHEPVMRRARELGVLCFSTPFGGTAVDFLETLDMPAYEIASFEIVHLPLIRKAAATGKALIISTFMAKLAEIGEAVRAARGVATCRSSDAPVGIWRRRRTATC